MDPVPLPHSMADVRMRGFTSRATVEQAWSWIDSVLPPLEKLPTEPIPLGKAARRVLAADVMSPIDLPGFVRSMMDGFALRGEETHGASVYNPIAFQIVGDAFPGRPFAGSLATGEAVRIMTGAPLPAGADAVLPAEQTEVERNRLHAMGEVPSGKHVGQVGEDVRRGALVATAGRRLRPQDLAMFSSLGQAELTVVRKPRAHLVITGNELLPAGTLPRGSLIADANGPMLQALVERDGGQPLMSSIVPDDPSEILAALEVDADLTIVSGGSSVGQEDFVPRLLAERGELAIHGIAMRPSSPTGMGRMSRRLVFLLPGNPVSCLCGYDFFASRAIRALAGLPREWPYSRMIAKLSRKLVSVVGRVDYARVRLVGGQVEPVAVSGASILSSTTIADGFVVLPADSEGYPDGAEVEVYLYGS